jgi:hypothetical protein
MTRNEIIKAVSQRVTDERVHVFADWTDCSTLDARATLEAEAFSAITGLPLDYHTDWRERI